jgi:hypothetical protein
MALHSSSALLAVTAIMQAVLLVLLTTTASALRGTSSSSTTSSISMRMNSNKLLSGFTGSRVLILGDGDFGFSAALSSMKICKELIASTKDEPARLFAAFPDAKSHCDAIIRNGDKVLYDVDATKIGECIKDSALFDTIAWNFPHVPGKQNIKYNRELLRAFFVSASKVLAPGGSIKVSLCEGQSGTEGKTKHDWNMSWKLPSQVAEAGLLLCDSEPFNYAAFDG